jgi:radical SAM superfamily enzyme YgiQ (UPF0313 family)
VTDEGLKAVNKKNTADNNVQAINILKDLGVGFTPNFIVDPAWDRDDFKRLRDWIETMGAYNSGFSILTPLPGTDLWDTAKQQREHARVGDVRHRAHRAADEAPAR